MMYGLKNEIVGQIKVTFQNFPQVRQAILYGSRAKGTFHNGSDIDITLKGKVLNLTILNQILLKFVYFNLQIAFCLL